MTYTADGEKLSKAAGANTKNYVSGIEYTGANLEAIYHGEGRLTPNGGNFYYEYTLKDHLGNVRASFRANGAAVTFLEETHYYPFGMQMEGLSTTAVTNNAYKYNSKEWNNDFGLGLSDYGARWYDASVGRWWSVDPLGEQYAEWSPYNYGTNNAISNIDPDGRESIFYANGNMHLEGADAQNYFRGLMAARSKSQGDEGQPDDPPTGTKKYEENLQSLRNDGYEVSDAKLAVNDDESALNYGVLHFKKEGDLEQDLFDFASAIKSNGAYGGHGQGTIKFWIDPLLYPHDKQATRIPKALEGGGKSIRRKHYWGYGQGL
jgi:RHS repeat-associated protein